MLLHGPRCVVFVCECVCVRVRVRVVMTGVQVLVHVCFWWFNVVFRK